MQAIKWHRKFNTGIITIDEYHKLLVKYINLLANHVQNKRPVGDIGDVLSGLANYTVRHFGYEEYLFQKYGYRDAQEHQSFIRSIIKLKDKYMQGQVSVTQEILDYLKSWMIHHILVSDMEYAPYIRNKITNTIHRSESLWTHQVTFADKLSKC